MKKFYLFITTMVFGCAGMVNAQNNETEITVTNSQGKQEIIDLPEAMTAELDSLLYLYNSKAYLHPDTNCNMPDVNPVYSKEIFKTRLSKIPTVIELPYNEVVQQFIDRYSSKLRRSVSYMLGAQNFYIPIFEEALEAYSLPLELKYLPVIESALNPKAVSRVGATGLWQFMLTTGKRYGLEVNSLVDERRDPIKSSYAAAHYLSDLYKIYGDWNLVIAAYNAGPEKINKAIHRSNGKTDYWEIYPYLPKETRGYVPAFIAANYIMNYYCDHNICPMLTDLPAKTDTIMVDKDIHFEQISHVLGIGVDQLASLNPQYRRNIVNGNSQLSSIKLPAPLVSTFIDKEDEILSYKSDNMQSKRIEVAINDEVPSYTSSRTTYSRSKSSRKKSKSRGGRGRSVTIRNGDTLSEIAARNHTTVKKLRKLNGIHGNSIRAGKKIRIK